MSHNDRRARMAPGPYSWNVTTAIGPLRPGHNRADSWSGTYNAPPGATVQDALDTIAAYVAREQGVQAKAIQFIHYTFRAA